MLQGVSHCCFPTFDPFPECWSSAADHSNACPVPPNLFPKTSHKINSLFWMVPEFQWYRFVKIVKVMQNQSKERPERQKAERLDGQLPNSRATPCAF